MNRCKDGSKLLILYRTRHVGRHLCKDIIFFGGGAYFKISK